MNREKLRPEFKEWLPLIGLSLAAFIFNTTEFAPIGLLSDIASDFGITEAKAGFLISAYAWVVALASLPLMLLFSKIERRLLLTILFVLFIGSHLFSYLSQSYTSLIISRLGVACSHAVFWAIASPLAVRVAPKGFRSFGLSLIAAGSSIAMILGLPLGRIVGLNFGWRMTFLSIAVLAFFILIIIRIVLPKVESSNSDTIKNLPSLFKRPALIGIYILTLLIITGHFTCYTYIEPFLINGVGLTPDFTTFVLLLFGVAGILGSVLFSRYSDKHFYRLAAWAFGGVVFSLLVLHIMAFSSLSLMILCVLWGVSMMLINLVLQSKVIQLAPDTTSIAMSIYSGIYNVGIGAGAVVGGFVCTHASVTEVGYVGGAVGALALIFFFLTLRKSFQQPPSGDDLYA